MNIVGTDWESGPSSSSDAVVELLDRVLNRGVVLYADIVITLAGVPLVGLNLRAALGSIEAMARAVSAVAPTDSVRLDESAPRGSGDARSEGSADSEQDERDLGAERPNAAAFVAEEVRPWSR